ncbi:MAG: hypothetical protein IKU55_01985 [Clostridia bacterium]|nr:hypothetical protein [Clostridia bacterium]
MKKLLALILAISLIASLLVGCAGTTVVVGNCTCTAETTQATNSDTPSTTTQATTAGTTAATTTDAAQTTTPDASTDVAVKTGLSVSTNISDSVSATADAAGAAKYDVTVAAVLVDDNGVIVSCVIDSIPATVNFNAAGEITADLAMSVPTKNEMGDSYGMVAWGGAIAEWDAQVAAVAEYAVGKTVDELKNGDIDMTTGKAKDGSDLSSSATIYLAGYVYAIEAAVNNAQHLGAKAGDELVLATLNSVSGSTSATAEKAGTAQLDADITALTKADGKITSCYIDSLQAKVSFDTTGAITTDLSAAVQTKNELGEAYGMVAWAGAIAEWDAQAASFAAYVTGKTAAEVAGIAITETTKPADGSDLASSVTIAIGGFQALIAKAMQ